jgi:hypothetical protein
MASLLPAADLTGKVASAGKPLPGAVVTARIGEVTETSSTKEDGTFALSVTGTGPVTLEVALFGFRPYKQTVSADDAGGPLAVNLELIAPRLTARPGNGEAVPEWAQSLTAQGVEAVAANVQAVEAPAPETAESADSVLVQGSMQRAGVDLPAGAPGFGPGGMGGGPMGAFGGGQGGMQGGMPGGGAFGPAGGGGGFGGRGGGGGGFGGPRGGAGGGGRPDFANMSPEERQKAIAEMRARRGNNGPEVFGNNATNRRQQYRGGAFWNFRNSAMDASSFALNGARTTKPDYNNSTYGLSLGGPLPLPSGLAKGSFFFLNYTGARGSNGNAMYGIVPTAAERAGDFSSTLTPRTQQPVALYDPSTKAPIPGGVIPSSQVSSIALGLLNFYPLPNQTGATQNYRLVYTTPQNSDSLNTRINKTVNRNRFDASINWQRRSGINQQLFGFEDPTSSYGVNSSLGYSRTISPRLVFNSSVRYNLNRNETTSFFSNGENIAAQLGIQGASTNPLNYGPPNLSFTNFASLSDSNPTLRRVQTMTGSVGLRYTRGAHAIALGADFTRNVWNLLAEQNARGTLFFGGSSTAAVNANGASVANTGFDLADFLLGYVQQSTIRSGGYDTYPRSHQIDGYVQDEWSIRKNLTLNVGVRYDYASPFTEKYGRMVNLDVAPGFTAVSPVVAGGTGPYSGKFSNALVNSDFNKFSPRLGLAYRPGTKRRTVIRSGFSLFYDNSIYNRIPGRLTAQPPFAETSTFITGASNTLSLLDPFTGPANVTVTNTYAMDKNLRTPYATTWSLSLEHELPGSLVASATYLGTKGTHLDVALWPNRLTSGTTTTSNASGYTYDTTVGNSIFNALQLRLNRRLRRGLQWTAYYQWSKSIDDATSIGGAGSTVIQNANDIEADRGLSSFDRRHNFTLSTMAVSPFGPRGQFMKRGDTFVSKLLSDWSATANLTLQTGAPLTATVLGTSADPSGTGAVGSGRANATGLPISSGSGPFNLLAFTVPAAGQYGTAGRNTIPGPGTLSLNATLGRTIQFGDSARRSLDIRLSANNVLNHVNITSWGTVVNSTNYGLASAAGAMRTLSLSLRVRF